MGIKHNAARVLSQLDDFFDERNNRNARIVRTVGFEVFRRIITRSPVDTGFYRSAHDLTIGQKSSFLPPPIEEKGKGLSGPGSSRAPQAEASLASINAKSLRKGVSIFVTNNAPYASILEHGHSLQAPNGVYSIVAAQIPELVKKAARLV